MFKKVFIFCDFGIDDMMVFFLVFFIDEIEIVGIVVDYGNVLKKMVVENVYFFNNEIKNRNIKIFGGLECFFIGVLFVFFMDVYGKQGFGLIILKVNVINGEMENFFEVIFFIEQYKDELIIVSLGRFIFLVILFIMCKQLMK